jgi:hypothetical protein
MMIWADEIDVEMEIASKSGVGTVVRIWLPLIDRI